MLASNGAPANGATAKEHHTDSMSATSRDTTWIAHEFDRRAATSSRPSAEIGDRRRRPKSPKAWLPPQLRSALHDEEACHSACGVSVAAACPTVDCQTDRTYGDRSESLVT